MPPVPPRRPAPAPKPAGPDRSGLTIGKCKLVRLIGRGGSGEVYLAEHSTLQKQVAVKLLSQKMVSSEAGVTRFQREAVATARLDHPNIIQVLDAGVEGDIPYIVMQYVTGKNLQKILDEARGPLEVREAVRIIRAVADALEAAHAAGIVHRDVKPANILTGERGEVKITDFGIARDEESEAALTATGNMVGTPQFMSPEQAEGKETDYRTDIYSLGVTLYNCVSGQRPFSGESRVEIMYKHVREDPPPLRAFNAAIPDSLSRIVLRMMEKKPEDRYGSCADVSRDLGLFLDGAPAAATPAKALPRPASRPEGRGPRPPSRLDAAPKKAPAPKKSSSMMTPPVIGGAVAAAVAIVALIAWATSGGEPARPKTSSTPTPEASATPDAPNKVARYNSIVERARDLEGRDPERAKELYQDALTLVPDGGEARAGIERLSGPPEDERAHGALLKLEAEPNVGKAVLLAEYRAFVAKFPSSRHADGVNRKIKELQDQLAVKDPYTPTPRPTPIPEPEDTPSPTPEVDNDPPPSLEPGFQWFADDPSQVDRFLILKGEDVPEVRPSRQHLALQTGSRQKSFLVTTQSDIEDFELRFDVKVMEGSFSFGARMPERMQGKLRLTVNLKPRRDDVYYSQTLRIEKNRIHGAAGDEPESDVPLSPDAAPVGCVFFQLGPDTRAIIRFARLKIISRGKDKAASPPVASAGDLIDAATITQLFKDGKEVAAREYEPVIARLKTQLEKAPDEAVSCLKANLERLEASLKTCEAAIRELSQQLNKPVVIRTRDGEKHEGTLKGVDRKLVMLGGGGGAEYSVSTNSIHPSAVCDLAKKQVSVLELSLFLVSDGDLAGAVAAMVAEVKRAKSQAPLADFVLHLRAMDSVGQIKGGGKELQSALDKFAPLRDQAGVDAGRELDRLAEQIKGAGARKLQDDLLALAGKGKHHEAVVKLTDWLRRAGNNEEQIKATCTQVYPSIMADGWLKYWDEKILSTAFSVDERGGGTARSKSGEITIDAPSDYTVLTLKALKAASGFAVEIKPLKFYEANRGGANFEFSRVDKNHFSSLVLFNEAWRLEDVDLRGDTKATLVVRGQFEPLSQNRWIEIAMLRLGPYSLVFVENKLVHIADGDYLVLNPDCAFAPQNTSVIYRNIRIRK